MMALVRTWHLHLAAGLVLLVALPIASRVFGAGYFSWTMYSGYGEYQIDIRVKDAAGRVHTVAPTALAEASSEATADLLTGADHFRRGPSLALLRDHLGDVAMLACRARGGVEADVVLHERTDESSPERATTAHATCK